MGVDQVLINLQGGWKASAKGDDCETMRVLASSTGLKRYLDGRSKLLDACRSAEAVRGLLDEGLALVALEGGEDDEGAVAVG